MQESLHEACSLASLGAKAKPVNAHTPWVTCQFWTSRQVQFNHKNLAAYDLATTSTKVQAFCDILCF